MTGSVNCFFFLVIFFHFSCNEECGLPLHGDSIRIADSIARIDSFRKADSISAKTDNLWTDSMTWKRAKIDGNLFVFGNIDQLEIYGKPDSIFISPNDCGSPLNWLDKKYDMADTMIYYYYPGMIFYTNCHTYILAEIDIQKHTLVFPSLNLNWDQNYTAERFAREFPRSARYARLNKNNNAEQNFKVSYENREDCWILQFKNGKLNHVKIWWLLC